MKRVAFTFASAILVSGLAFTGCKKQKDALFDQSAIDNASADAQYNDLDNIVSDVMIENNAQLRGTEDNERTTVFRNCGTVTITPASKTILIDFGTGSTCNDGRTRKGRIRVVYTNKYFTPGSVITTNPEEYFVNDVKVEGTKIVSNVTQTNGPTTHTISVRNGRLTYADASVITWQTDRVRVWQSGQADTNPFNDVFQITGTASGVNKKSKNFTAEITTPIIIKTECFQQGIRKPVSGVYVVTAENTQKTVDFGDGTCNRNITVSIANLGSFTFVLND